MNNINNLELDKSIKYKYACRLMKLHAKSYFTYTNMKYSAISKSGWDVDKIVMKLDSIIELKLLSPQFISELTQINNIRIQKILHVLDYNHKIYDLMKSWTDMTKNKWRVNNNKQSFLRNCLNNEKYYGISPIHIFNIYCVSSIKFPNNNEMVKKYTNIMLESYINKIDMIKNNLDIKLGILLNEFIFSLNSDSSLYQKSQKFLDDLMVIIFDGIKELLIINVLNYNSILVQVLDKHIPFTIINHVITINPSMNLLII